MTDEKLQRGVIGPLVFMTAPEIVAVPAAQRKAAQQQAAIEAFNAEHDPIRGADEPHDPALLRAVRSLE